MKRIVRRPFDATVSRVYSADGMLMAEIGEQRRIPLSIREIPALQTQAFLAAEDDNFPQWDPFRKESYVSRSKKLRR